MSDTVKLIIEIPTDFYEITKAKVAKNMTHALYATSIANGIPLDDIKAEIEKEENIWYHDCEPENGWKHFDVIRVDTVFEILDNINKESEG